jgi:hypothetical protein
MKTASIWLVVISAALFGVAYSVGHFGWPAVGFEAAIFVSGLSTLAGFVCLVIASILLVRHAFRARHSVQQR